MYCHVFLWITLYIPSFIEIRLGVLEPRGGRNLPIPITLAVGFYNSVIRKHVTLRCDRLRLITVTVVMRRRRSHLNDCSLVRCVVGWRCCCVLWYNDDDAGGSGLGGGGACSTDWWLGRVVLLMSLCCSLRVAVVTADRLASGLTTDHWPVHCWWLGACSRIC